MKLCLRRIVPMTGRPSGGFRDAGGAVAVELAVAVPFLVLLIIGVIDFGAYMNSSQAIAAATRVGAEYARDSTACQQGIQVVPAPAVSAACSGAVSPPSGIAGAVQNAINFSPGALSVAAPALSCQCDDGNAIACGNNSCKTAGRPGPNRVFLTVSATLTINPIIPWPGFPTTIPGLTVIRLWQ